MLADGSMYVSFYVFPCKMQNVKAYLRRGAARESLGLHREALQGLATNSSTFTFAVY